MMETRNREGRATTYVLAAVAVLVIILVAAFAASPVLYGYLGKSGSHNSGSTSATTTSSTTTSITSTSTTQTHDAITTSTTSTTTTTSTSSDAGYWVTYHGNNSRDGYDSSFPTVSSTPPIAWKTQVDAPVYAEPLSFNGSVFIATENDTVYSLSASTGGILWATHLATPADSVAAPYLCDGHGPDITPTIGITGTPVIDAATGTMYVAALVGGTGYDLYAISTSTGHVLWKQAVTTTGFNYVGQEERGALVLADGFVYVPFGGYSWSCTPSFGWIIGVSASDNGTTYSFQDNTQSEGDIWAPEGITVGSSGNLYAATGNSYYNATYNYADSVLELNPQLKLIDSFAPANWAYIGPADLDQDTTGVTLLPHGLAFSIGKVGMGYLLNASDLGGIGGQLYGQEVCSTGAWGATAYASGMVFVPCATGLYALSIQTGAKPSFSVAWNFTGPWAGPPVVAGGLVWTLDILSGKLYGLNMQTGALVAQVTLDLPAHFATPSVAGDILVCATNATVFGLGPA